MIRSERPHLLVSAQTHAGMTGKNNEDRYAVSAYRLDSRAHTPSLFAILCDGIGGHRAGEVAAEMAVNTISQYVAQSDAAQPIEILARAIQDGSQRVFELANSDAEHLGMGATCACAWVIGNRLYTATVGDSRIYLLRRGRLRQVSIDHTWIQEALERGLITPDQVAGHPNAHVIRRYLGSPTPPEPDFRLSLHDRETEEQALANQGFTLQRLDLLLLCSDGLTDLVKDDEIQAILTDQEPDQAVQTLVDLANERGGRDNITIVALQVPPKPIGEAVVAARPHRPVSLSCLGLLVIVALAGAMAYWFWNSEVNAFLNSLRPLGTPVPTVVVTLTVQTVTPLAPNFPLPCTDLDCPTPTRTPTLRSTAPAAGSTRPAGTGAPTLTPWPTNTSRPTASPTASFTAPAAATFTTAPLP